jgi:hypothetical protein
MAKFSIFVSIILCGFIIYLTEFLPKKHIYDCSMVSYPIAIDIPKDVIEQCKQKGMWIKK